MTLDGARRIEEVAAASWTVLAREAGYSDRFARTATVSVIEKVVEKAEGLAGLPQHQNETVEKIITAIRRRIP